MSMNFVGSVYESNLEISAIPLDEFLFGYAIHLDFCIKNYRINFFLSQGNA